MKSFQIYKLGEMVVISAVSDESLSAVPIESQFAHTDLPPGGIALSGWNLEPSNPLLEG